MKFSDKSNLSLIYESSIQTQRAFMKEIQRRRAAGEPPLTPAERGAFIKQLSIPENAIMPTFYGIIKIGVRIGSMWLELTNTPRVSMEFDAVDPDRRIEDVMSGQMTHLFLDKMYEILHHNTIVRGELIAKNHGYGVSDETLTCLETIIDLEKNTRDMGSMPMSDIAPSGLRMRVDSEFEVNTNKSSGPITSLRMSLFGLFANDETTKLTMEVSWVKHKVEEAIQASKDPLSFFGGAHGQHFIQFRRHWV